MNREQILHLWKQFTEKYPISDNYFSVTINGILSDDYWFNRYTSVIQLLKDKVVLDVGCGVGFHSCMISLYAKQVLGIDINTHFIHQTSFFSSIFKSDNILVEQKNISCIDKEYISEHSINGVFIKGMLPSVGPVHLKEIYEKFCEFQMDVVIVSNYFPSTNVNFINTIALPSFPCLKKRYDLIREDNGFLIFHKK